MAEADMHVPTPKINSEASLIRSSRSSLNNVSDRKKIEPKPLKGKVAKRELTFMEKLKRSFVKEDLKDIRDYVVFDIVIPGIRKGFFDMVVGTAGQLFGVSVPSSVYSPRGYSPANTRLTPHERRYRDYTSIQREGTNGYSGGVNRAARYDRFMVSDWSFEYKEDADSVLEQLIDICDYEGWVSVGQFFNLADPNGTAEGRNPYTNNDYGWHSLDNVSGPRLIQGVGYVLDLPPARPR